MYLEQKAHKKTTYLWGEFGKLVVVGKRKEKDNGLLGMVKKLQKKIG